MTKVDQPKRLRIESYKPSGKYYTTGCVDLPPDVPYFDARKFVSQLPNLPGVVTAPGRWQGYYVIGCDENWDDWHSYLVDCTA